MDNIVVFSPDQESYIERLDRMLHGLQQANLKIKPNKTHLFQKKVEYVWHIVDEHVTHTDPKKIEAIQGMASPKNIQELRSFLGLTGYYRRFIPNYGDMTYSLYKQLRKRPGQKKLILKWDSSCEQAFQQLKQAMTSHTVLAYPNYEKPFILDTDCSRLACGGVLSQMQMMNDLLPIIVLS